MASDQFIMELFSKLHPRSKKYDVGDLTQAELDEVNKRIDERHTITIMTDGANVATTILLDDLKSVATAAELDANKEMRTYKEMNISAFLNLDESGLCEEAVARWFENFDYHKRRHTAAQRITQEIVDPTIEATCRQGIEFYL